MFDNASNKTLMTTGCVKDYFYQSLNKVCERRSTDASDSSLAYIVNLLDQYVRVDQLFEWNQDTGYGLQPLALMYGEAVNARDEQHRISALRRLGDIALFISGLFVTSLVRKPVDVNYYIKMGGGAYGWLSESLQRQSRSSLNPEVFRELSQQFGEFVGVLDEFADTSSLRSDKDMLKLYEDWLSSNDPATASKLSQTSVASNGTEKNLIH
ncbi:MAG: hypothetical protein WBM41_02830 [Arenicellales bacterium]